MSKCKHENAISFSGGLLRFHQNLHDYMAAYCPDCKGIREESAFSDNPEPWLTTKWDLNRVKKEDRIRAPKIKEKKKKTKRKRKKK